MPSSKSRRMVLKTEIKAAMKKLLIIFNVLLASIFAYRLFALNADLRYEEKDAGRILKNNIVQIRRPSFDLTMKYRNIFAIKAPEEPHPTSSLPSNSDLKGQNELVTGDMVLRVRGIFIWVSGRYAVVSLMKGKRGKNEEWRKIAVGDQINKFTIHSIEPDIVILEAPSSAIIRLSIFKRS